MSSFPATAQAIDITAVSFKVRVSQQEGAEETWVKVTTGIGFRCYNPHGKLVFEEESVLDMSTGMTFFDDRTHIYDQQEYSRFQQLSGKNLIEITNSDKEPFFSPGGISAPISERTREALPRIITEAFSRRQKENKQSFDKWIGKDKVREFTLEFHGRAGEIGQANHN